jgi:uncharacterized protein (TIRG00374 family)
MDEGMREGQTVSKKLRVLVSIALLTWLAWRTDWGQIGQAFVHLHFGLWLGAVGLYLLAQLASAWRWRLLAQPLGFHGSLYEFLRVYFVGMFFNLLLPTSVGGDVVRAWYLDGGSGRRMPAFLSVFVDRFSGLLVLLVLACVAELLCPIPLPWWIGASTWTTAACAALGLLALPAVARRLEEWDSSKTRIGQRLCALTLSLSRFLSLFYRRTRLLLVTTALSLLIQVVNVLLVGLIGRALETPIPVSYYGIVVPMVTLLTLLPVSLNGMGVREGGMVLFLTPLGISSATALSLSLLWFSVFAVASLMGGGVYFFSNLSRPGEPVDDPFVGRDSDQGRARQPKAAA